MPALLPDPAAEATALRSALGELAERFDIRWLASCPSTNSELTARAPATDERIRLLVADEQTAGRGRRGRQWQSWPGGSLTFSLQCGFTAGSHAPAGLSLATGVAVAQTLEELGVAGVQLKWPNDVLINDDKLAGILVELQTGAQRALLATIGIGLNLELPPAADIGDARGVTDLASELGPGALPPRPLLLARLLRALLAMLERYRTDGFAAFHAAWEERNAFANLPVRILGEQDAFEGICVGVDADGALLLERDERIERILSGDVSLRPLAARSA